MKTKQHEQQIQYMLHRSVGILITSGWSEEREVSIAIQPNHSSLGQVAHVYHPLLLFVVNTVAMWPSFQQNVMEPLKHLINCCNKSNSATLDLSAIVAEKQRHGKVVPIYRHACTPGQPCDHRAAAFVVVEYHSHFILASDILGKIRHYMAPKHALHLQNEVAIKTRIVSDLIEQLERRDILPITWARDKIQDTILNIQNMIVGDAEKWVLFFDIMSGYRNMTKPIFERYEPSVQPYPQAVRWRKLYISMDSGLGSGVHIRYVQPRHIPYLYEVWCFAELCNLLSCRGLAHILQMTTLQNRRPSFRVAGTQPVYYNYYGHCQEAPNINRLQYNSHVEWFIKDEQDYHNSIIVDTKYKYYDRWRPNDTLTVLGYMNEFSVDRAVIFFSCPLRSEGFVGHSPGEKIVKCSFGRNNKERHLWVVSLKPGRLHEAENSKVLEMLIAELWPKK